MKDSGDFPDEDQKPTPFKSTKSPDMAKLQFFGDGYAVNPGGEHFTGLRLVSNNKAIEVSLQHAFQSGNVLNGIYVTRATNDVERLIDKGDANVSEIQVPLNPSARQKFLAEWAAKNTSVKKSKVRAAFVAVGSLR